MIHVTDTFSIQLPLDILARDEQNKIAVHFHVTLLTREEVKTLIE